MYWKAIFVLVSVAAQPVLAGTDVACWNRNVERIDYYINPPEKGDNNFFTAVSNTDQTTNVVLIYSATASMKDFTQKLYRIRADLGGAVPTGCTNAYLSSRTYFMPSNIAPPAGSSSLQGVYSASKVYPDPGPTYSGGAGQSDDLSNASFYRYRNWGANGAGIVAETADGACTAAGGPTQLAACKACVQTAGYWLNPLAANNDVSPSAGVFSGNWLRFNPPKWTMMSLAYKRLVNGPLLAVLREGVVAQNGSNGGEVVQFMLPQSCRGVGRPMTQKLKAVDDLSYVTSAKPLAEMLFNTAWYMAGQPSGSPWPFSNASTQGGTAMSSGKSGVCNNCNGDFIVLFSDGRGDSANPSCTPVAGVTPPHCTVAANCSTVGMGNENDGNDFLDPALAGGAGTLITGSTVRQTPGGTCDMDFSDDVAKWMASGATYQSAASTRVRTFVVGIGDPNNTYGEMSALQAVATSGQGDFMAADTFAALETSILTVMTSIISRATSFSAAAVTTVQTQGYTSVLIPRFRPNGGVQWQGNLLRYDVFNEFSSGCSSSDYNTKTSLNPNGNSSCTDVYLTDKNSKIIGENSDGVFVELDTSKAYDGGWPVKASADGGTYPATPYWEAASVLAARQDAVLAGDTSKARKIYTVAPQGSNGTYSPTLIPFDLNNLSTLTKLLALGGVSGDFCKSLGFQTRHSYATEEDCAADVVRFMHGEDVLSQNPYNRTTPQPPVRKSRPNILGDIFHSTPVLVTPPIPTFICDLGVANQCVASLSSSTLTPGGAAAYKQYATDNQYRTQMVVVGANDGMIHAFNAGKDTVRSGIHSFDTGTGEELWAFIPPDLLPKLIRYVIGERHELMVDATPMVRDIWVDANSDYTKSSSEFHTVAVFGEREGGRSLTGLDISNPTAPAFLWAWPPPGSTQALNKGESWNDIGPAAPPIGPIAEKDPSGKFQVNGVASRERYVVSVGGGWDPAYLRGRAIHFLDAWTGQEVFRYSAREASSSSDPRKQLFPVAAPVAMLDTNADGLFDSAVVGDTGGQVWTVSMSNPGEDTDSDGLYDNWYAARAFKQFKGQPFWHRSSFFQKAVAAQLGPDDIRIYLGAGNRDQIKDPNGGTCSLPNLEACLRKNCSVTSQAARYSSGSHLAVGGLSYSAGAADPSLSLVADTGGASASCTDVADTKVDFSINCGSSQSFTSEAYCDWSSADGCPTATGRPTGTAVPYTATTMEKSRFYAIKLFDSGAGRPLFKTSAEATAYDSKQLTDTDLVNADTTSAVEGGKGWYVVHANSIDEKSASPALLLGGCVVWSTLVPNPADTATCGGTATLPLDTAYAYQAEVTSGALRCGSAGSTTANAQYRSVPRSTYVAPQQPSMVVSVNSKTGTVAYGSISIEPGSPPQSLTTGFGEIMGAVHWLEVPRSVHDCRHAGNCN